MIHLVQLWRFWFEVWCFYWGRKDSIILLNTLTLLNQRLVDTVLLVCLLGSHLGALSVDAE